MSFRYAALCTLLFTGCIGDIGSQAGPGAGTGNGTPEIPGAGEENVGRFGDQIVIHDTRRLNDTELRNTV
ncbi:MAG: hypothetical protein KC416_02350, partial [Myxococcales bacterium]|nr:hypothetical protein [Myxococcales bacterium]